MCSWFSTLTGERQPSEKEKRSLGSLNSPGRIAPYPITSCMVVKFSNVQPHYNWLKWWGFHSFPWKLLHSSHPCFTLFLLNFTPLFLSVIPQFSTLNPCALCLPQETPAQYLSTSLTQLSFYQYCTYRWVPALSTAHRSGRIISGHYRW